MDRYNFCEENKHLLLNFIKKANECKTNPYCNIIAFNNLSKILPLAPILDKYQEEHEIIDIIESDEENALEDLNKAVSQILQNNIQPLKETVVDDMSCAIKETLHNKKNLTSAVISDLHKPNLDLDNIFKQLFTELNFEEIINLGNLINYHDVANDNLILAYVKQMLLNLLPQKHSDQFQENLNKFCSNYPEILAEELSNYLLNTTGKYSRTTLQYIDGLDNNFKSKLLRILTSKCNNLEENHIAILDILLRDETDNDILNKLVELMFKSTDIFSTNKLFGKFLLKVIQLTEKNISMVEKPLKHIIRNHRTIWKAKIEKTFNDLIQDSILMSQSFQY